MSGALGPGQILSGTYRVDRLLGRGGMAEVYAVTHTRLGRQFALKLLRLDLALRGPFLARFEREAEILGRLRHPHIVDVSDWNRTAEGEPYLVMELLAGEDLGRFLCRSGALSPRRALAITAQIGAALSAAHRVGVVHRDLKPSNIFLLAAGPLPDFVKVLDFGIARLEQPDKPLTGAEELLGTPGYMAPEQAQRRAGEVDPRADQFALAAILYELLAGRPAFYRPGESVFSSLERVLHTEPPPLPPAARLPSIERALARALRKCPAERFPSVEAFLAAAAEITVPAAASASPQPAPPRSIFTDAARRRYFLVAVLVSTALAITAWAWMVFS